MFQDGVNAEQMAGRRRWPYLAQEIMLEPLRHSTIRATLDSYTQSVTTEKRNAQDAVAALLFQKNAGNVSPAWEESISSTFCAFLWPREME